MSAGGDRLAAALTELADAIRAEVKAEATADLRPAPDRLLSIDEAAATLGIGRTRLYREVGAGQLRTVKVGRRRLVPAGAIAGYIAAHQAVAGAGT